MKKLIFIFLLFKGCFAFGQVDSGYIIEGGRETPFHTIYFDTTGRVVKRWQDNSQRLDTIPCLLLVCDTGRWEGQEYIPIMSGAIHKGWNVDLSNEKQVGLDSNYVIADYNERVYWIKGYYIRANLILLNWYGNYEPVCLDENKNTLSKNIIVWLTK